MIPTSPVSLFASLLALLIICIVTGIIYLVGLGVYRAIRWLKENL